MKAFQRDTSIQSGVSPDHIFENFFDEFADDTIYMRCLSEEYGCGLVSMNIYDKGEWKIPQYFDL